MNLTNLKKEMALSLTIPKGSLLNNLDFGHRFKEIKVVNDLSVSKASSYAKEACAWIIKTGRAEKIESYAFSSGSRIYVETTAYTKSGDEVPFSTFFEV